MISNNLLLYGSLARGDAHEASDIDLLSVIAGKSKKIIKGRINLSLYNKEKIREMAIIGSLFVYHLVSEGVVLSDDDNVLGKDIFSLFVRKDSYVEEMLFSRYLLSLIECEYHFLKKYRSANLSVSWCIRTFIAGLGANNDIPLFSVKKISEELGAHVVKYLNIKNSVSNDINVIYEIGLFMDKYIDVDYADYMYSGSLIDYKEKVMKKINSEIEFQEVMY